MARALRSAVADAGERAGAAGELSAATGIDRGWIGEIAPEDATGFTSAGSGREFASRLRDFAGAGQIFVSADIFDELAGARGQSLGDVRLNAFGETKPAYSVTDDR